MHLQDGSMNPAAAPHTHLCFLPLCKSPTAWTCRCWDTRADLSSHAPKHREQFAKGGWEFTYSLMARSKACCTPARSRELKLKPECDTLSSGVQLLLCPRKALGFSDDNSFSVFRILVYLNAIDKSYPNKKGITGIKEPRRQPCAVAPSHQVQSVTFCYKMLKFDKFK